MKETIKLCVKQIYKLNEDYNNVFINNTANFIADYIPLPLSSRTINKTHYEDIYILEPNSYYCIEFKENIDCVDYIHVWDFDDVLMSSGLLMQFNIHKQCLYVYNTNQNMIYIQQGAIILKIEVE